VLASSPPSLCCHCGSTRSPLQCSRQVRDYAPRTSCCCWRMHVRDYATRIRAGIRCCMHALTAAATHQQLHATAPAGSELTARSATAMRVVHAWRLLRSALSAARCAGTHSAVIYNSKGELLDSFELPGSPAAPLLLCDFSGNGLTDIVLVADDAIYGFQLLKNMGAGMPYATMLAGLLLAVIVVFVTQQGPLSSQKTRSTDRID
jgi:hypothetical protein